MIDFSAVPLETRHPWPAGFILMVAICPPHLQVFLQVSCLGGRRKWGRGSAGHSCLFYKERTARPLCLWLPHPFSQLTVAPRHSEKKIALY